MARPRLTPGPLLVAAAGLLLPVRSTAAWLGGAHGTTMADIELGVWILKAALLSTAVTMLLVRRYAPDLAAAGAGGIVPHEAGSGLRDDRTTALLLAAILSGALVLRLLYVNTELWFDEIDTLFRYVTLPVPQILSTYDSQNHHPLYTLLSRVAYVFTRGAEWSIRLPAVAFGVASLWATWWFARRIASRAEALLAPLVLAVSYHHVWFSQNARGYTGILFFAIVASALFLRLLNERETNAARTAWAYALVTALAAYTHLTAVLVTVGHAVALLALVPWRDAGRLRSALRWPVTAIGLAALLTLTAYALVLPQVLSEILAPPAAAVSREWTSWQWLVRETLRVLGSGVPGGMLTVSAGIGVLAVGAMSYWRRSRGVVLVTMTPVVVTAAVMLGTGHNLWPRFFFFAAAFFVLFALRGGFVLVEWVLRERGRRVAVIGAVAVSLLSTAMLPRAWYPKQQFRAAAAYVEGERREGDAVVAVNMAAYVYALSGPPAGWQLTSGLDTLLAVERAARRTWVLYTFPERLRTVHPELSAHLTGPDYDEVRVFGATIGGGEIRVLRHERPHTGSHVPLP